MRKSGERPLLLLVGVISLLLTTLTVWAVWKQAAALQSREWADLRSAAARAATSRIADFRNDAQRAADAAVRAWQTGGAEALDEWIRSQREWVLAGVLVDGRITAAPLTPLDDAAPLPGQPGTRGTDRSTPPVDAGGSVNATVAKDEDPGSRGRALLAVAAVQQNIGRRLDAARTYADAARALRAAPRFARFAFQADLAAAECLLAERADEQALAVIEGLLAWMLESPLAAFGEAELAMIRDRIAISATQAGLGSAPVRLAGLLEMADGSAGRRALAVARLGAVLAGAAQLPGVAVTMIEPAAGPSGRDEHVQFAGRLDDQPALVFAVRPIGQTGELALALFGSDAQRRYWEPPDPAASWRIAPADAADSSETLYDLGTAFGGARLVPSPGEAERLSGLARRRFALVGLTAVGSLGGWAVVIWMLMRAVNRQRELVELQRRFVADVSHELKTPLALIRLSAETLRDRRVVDPNRTRAYHDTIVRESERLTSLLDTILDFSRIESGRQVIKLAACDVGDVAFRAWSLFEPQFAADGFDARLEVTPDLPAIQADPQALQQVIVNLLQNAYRYSGGGKFVRLSVRKEGYTIVIVVEDHGIGMSRDQLDRVGDSFFRAEDTRVRRTRGAGLGLAIVNHLVQAHHGKIEVHSRPGEGSTFTVWLPFEPPNQN